MLPALIESGQIKLPEKVEQLQVENEGESLGFSVSLDRPNWRTKAPILPCGILNRDPVDYLKKKYMCFEADKLWLRVRFSYFLGVGRRAENFEMDLTQNAELFRNFWKQLTDDLNGNKDIAKFNAMRKELIPVCDGLLSRLKKHIETYVKTEDI